MGSVYSGRQLLVLPALLLAACATTPDVDPVAIKLDDVDTRLGRVEAVVNNQSLVELSRRIDALEAQLRLLRGSSEETQNSSEALRKQQRDLYADLDRRLKSLEGAGVLPAADAAGGSATNAPVGAGAARAGDDQASYARAMDTLKAGDYAAAITLLKSFANRYSNSALLDNVQYWLGEAYYVTRDYGSAATAFRSVGERWPNSRKAGDALLKLGYTQYEQKQTAAARSTLQQVVVRFPGTEAARLATERLTKLRAEAR